MGRTPLPACSVNCLGIATHPPQPRSPSQGQIQAEPTASCLPVCTHGNRQAHSNVRLHKKRPPLLPSDDSSWKLFTVPTEAAIITVTLWSPKSDGRLAFNSGSPRTGPGVGSGAAVDGTLHGRSLPGATPSLLPAPRKHRGCSHSLLIVRATCQSAFVLHIM